MALVDWQSHQEIAKQFRISTQVVSRIVNLVKHDNQHFSEGLEKQNDMLKRREVVAAYVHDLNETHSVIDSVK